MGAGGGGSTVARSGKTTAIQRCCIMDKNNNQVSDRAERIVEIILAIGAFLIGGIGLITDKMSDQWGVILIAAGFALYQGTSIVNIIKRG